MFDITHVLQQIGKPKGAEKTHDPKHKAAAVLYGEAMALWSRASKRRLKLAPDAIDIEPLENIFAPSGKLGQPTERHPKKDAKPDGKESKEDDLEAIAKLADSYRKKGLSELDEAHKDLPKTRSLAFKEKYKLKANRTPLEIARTRLGKGADNELVQAYAHEICWLNDLGENATDKALAKGKVIKLPGLTKNGGLITHKFGNKAIIWPDGSRYEQHENGHGRIVIPLQGGRERHICFNPVDRDENAEREYKGEQLLKNVFIDKKGRTVIEDEFKAKRAGRMTIVDDAKKEKYVLRLRNDGQYHQENGGNVGFDPDTKDYRDIVLYRQVEGKAGKLDIVTKTFEDGKTKTFNKTNDELLSESHVDKLGRRITANYRPGESSAYEYEITFKEKDKPVKFKRLSPGAVVYSAPNLVDDKVVGTIEYEPTSGLILFLDKDKKRGEATLEDGTKVERIILDKGGHKVIKSKGKESLSTTYDLAGKPILEESTYADGTKFSTSMHADGQVYKAEIREPGPGGSKTLLELDEATGVVSGFRCDALGTKLERVYLGDDQLLYKDLKTGKMRAERLQDPGDKELLSLRTKCDVDIDRGTLSFERKGVKIIRPISGGREDKVDRDGTIHGTTITGTRSYVLPNGEAAVMHDDLTGVRLNRNGTIDRWGPNPGDNARGEKLLAVEARFLSLNRRVDRRDVAEIHRRFAGDPEQLSRFYEELIALGKDKRIPAAKRLVLRDTILRDVATGMAYQGTSTTCNSAVTQQAELDECADVYARTLHRGFATGKLKTADGKTVHLDLKNLYMADSTGRNLSSRAFQTLAVQALYEGEGKRVVRNHEDGILRLYELPFKKDSEPKVFTGLNMAQIAEVRYKLTGQEKACCLVENVKDLVDAFEKYGKKGKGMTISVFPQKHPFTETKDGAPDANDGHVVTITRIEKHPEKGILVYVKNQWGLAADHQTHETAFRAEDLMKNMKQTKIRVDGELKAFGEVLIDGKPGTGYRMDDGKAIVDPFATVAIKRERNMVLEK
jgi:hypothetical protein